MAVVIMIFWQIFDFLVEANIYTDAPYAIQAFNAPPHFFVLVLFVTMSGASLYISMSKRLKKGMSKGDLLKRVVKRYGSFVVISLLFTTFVFGFCTFFRWEEAIQGIGLTAIVASLIILSGLDSALSILAIVIGLVALQPLAVGNISALTQGHMFCSTNMDISQIPSSLLINASVRGFFSFTNLLPFMLTGVLLGKATMSGLLKKRRLSFLAVGVLLIVAAFMLHYYHSLNPSAEMLSIDFYARSYPILMLEIGIAVGLFALVEHIDNSMAAGLVEKTLDFFVPFGVMTLVAYFGHFLLVYKPLQMLAVHGGIQIMNNMGPATAATFSLLSVLFFYKATVEWIKKPSKTKKFGYAAILVVLTMSMLAYLYSSESSPGTTYVLITVDVERDLVPFLDSYDGIVDGLPIILDVLGEYDVKATFFVTGNVVSRYPDSVDEIFENGHEIGGHGIMHEDFSTLEYGEKYETISQMTDLLEKYDVKTFRSPHQSMDDEVVTILEELGYCAEACYKAEGTTRMIRESMMSITSEPLLYPSSTYPALWIDVFNQALDRQNETKDKVIMVGLHSWEVLELPDVEGAEEYVTPSGEYAYTNLVDLLEYLNDKKAKGEDIQFVTAKDICELFLGDQSNI
jgi:peptidoglycan/xylan/chitin deacetylase (PgdA/CDA1 family)